MNKAELERLEVGSQFKIESIDAVWEVTEPPTADMVVAKRIPPHPLVIHNNHHIYTSQLLRGDVAVIEVISHER